MNAYHFLGGGNFLAVSHLQFGMRRDDQCQGAGDDYGYNGYLGYFGYLECTETTSVKVLMVMNMDVTQKVLDYTWDHVAESNIFTGKKGMRGEILQKGGE